MDLAEKIPFFTLDVISHIGLGSPFGNIVSNKDVNDYLKSSEEGLKIGNTAFGMGLGWMRENPIIGPAISPSEKDPTGYGRMMLEARKIVDARRSKSVDDKSDMLASFIRNGVSGDDLFQEAFEQILECTPNCKLRSTKLSSQAPLRRLPTWSLMLKYASSPICAL